MAKRDSGKEISTLNTGLLLLALLIALLLSGCAATPVKVPALAWTPDETWWVEAGRSGRKFTARDGSIKVVQARHAKNVHEVNRKIQTQSGLAASIALEDSDTPNAFAADSNGERLITLSLPFLAAIGDDRDALATSIGHEVAHLYYAHGATRKERNQAVIGSTMAIAGIITVNTSFSRFEEREADIKGMEWAVAAGFSPCGSARTIRMLEAYGRGADGNPFMATHPGHTQRIARANALSQELTGKGC